MYSGDMKSSAIINQTPCRGGQCLNISDQRESQGGIHEFHSPTSWPPPQLDGATHHRQTAGWCWLYWSHTHCLLGNATSSTKERISINFVCLFISQHRGQALAFSGSLTSCQRLFPSPPSPEPAPRVDPPRYQSALLHLQVEFFNVKIKIPFFTFCWVIER